MPFASRMGLRAMNTKAMSVRLSEQMAEELAAVARIDGAPISEVLRDAIASHIVSRRADPGFQSRLREKLEKEREVLESLAPLD